MVYVDLNPVRSRMAETPEASDHTSVKKRIQHVLNIEQSDYQKLQPEGLYPFVGNPRIDMPDGLPFELSEYIELVDLTGRQLREGGKGSIDVSELPILQRLGIENDNWKELTRTLLCSCNHDISASMRVHALLHPATAILVHPCTSLSGKHKRPVSRLCGFATQYSVSSLHAKTVLFLH